MLKSKTLQEKIIKTQEKVVKHQQILSNRKLVKHVSIAQKLAMSLQNHGFGKRTNGHIRIFS